MKLKPGLLTTEFYATLATLVVGLLVVLEVLEAGAHKNLITAVTELLSAAGVVVSAAAVVVRYIEARTELKLAAGGRATAPGGEEQA